MRSIVLVHGSWFGAWCWSSVAARLREDGWDVHTPDLPAHGEDRTPVAEATLDAYAGRVIDRLDRLAEPAVLVGHSMAGVVLSTVAERRPQRVKKLVYLAAYLAADGQSIFQLATTDGASALGPHLRPDEKAGVIAVAPEGFAAALVSGASPADVERARSAARPDPLAPLATPVHVTPERFGRVPRVYLQTQEDRAVSTDLQARMLAATPTETLPFPGGHSPFLTHPAELARALAAAAA
jgi:pimeloyl-ACP methyl ester carboxylesterase